MTPAPDRGPRRRNPADEAWMARFDALFRDHDAIPAHSPAGLGELMDRWEAELGAPSEHVRNMVTANLGYRIRSAAARRLDYGGRWAHRAPEGLPPLGDELVRACGYCAHFGFPRALDLDHEPSVAERIVGRLALEIAGAEGYGLRDARYALGDLGSFLREVGHPLPEGTPAETDYKMRDASPFERVQHAQVRVEALRRMLADIAADLDPAQRRLAQEAARAERAEWDMMSPGIRGRDRPDDGGDYADPA